MASQKDFLTVNKVRTHIVVPEGLNRSSSKYALSDYYRTCLERVASTADDADTVYLAPGNCFGRPHPEDEVAEHHLRQLRPGLKVVSVGVPRTKYLDTLDNAILLRHWAERRGLWPMPAPWLYCNRYHAFRSWLCFRASGYQIERVITSSPTDHSGAIVARLKYYDLPPAHMLYEALAVCYTVCRLAKNLVVGPFDRKWSRNSRH